MKKILVIITLVSVSFFAKAQTSAGNMMLGGTVAVTSTNYGGTANASSSSFTLNPSFGYFVKDNFVVGANLSLSSGKDNNGVTQIRSNSFGFGPFARLYKFTSSEQFAFFANASFNFGANRVDNGNNINKVNTVTFAVSPGFAYFFNEHWAAELAISGLSIQNSKNPDASGAGTTYVYFGISSFNPSLGLRYHFGN